VRTKHFIVLSILQVAAFAVAGEVRAVDAAFGLRLETLYNSNFRALPENPDPAVRSLLGPELRLSDRDGKLAYQVSYNGSYSVYFEPWQKDLNAWEQSVRALATYQLSRRTRVTLRDSFHDQVAIRFNAIEQDDLTDTLDAGRSPFHRNSFGMTLEHSFSPRISGSLSIENDWVNFERNLNQSDSLSMGSGGQLSYAIDRADRVGLGAAFAYQVYDGQDFRLAGSRGRIYNAFASWEHRFDKDFSFSISGGPTLIETDSAREVQVFNFGAFIPEDQPNPNSPVADFVLFDPSCVVQPGSSFGLESACAQRSPPLPLSDGPPLAVVTLPFVGSEESEQDFTFFARFNVVKRWDNFEINARYNRTQSNAAGDSGTSTLDRVVLRAKYDPSRLWSFYASGSWNRRQRATRPVFAGDFVVVDGEGDAAGFAQRVQVVESLGERKIGTDQITAIVGTRRQLTRQLSGTLEFQYRYQFTTRSGRRDQRVDFFLLNALFNYDFDPVRL